MTHAYKFVGQHVHNTENETGDGDLDDNDNHSYCDVDQPQPDPTRQGPTEHNLQPRQSPNKRHLQPRQNLNETAGHAEVAFFEILVSAPILSASEVPHVNHECDVPSSFAGYCLESGAARSVTGKR